MNYGVTTMRRAGETITIKRLEDFIEFKRGDKSLIVSVATKRKKKKD
jgi:hypothetical protein